MPAARTQAEHEAQEQRKKLANSYQSLLNEFSANDLQTVGNYSIGRLIGKGSFGKVYLASHKLTNGSKVVLKSAKKDDSNLAREIHHHRQFLHPHIARLYEVMVTESMVWLVLEYCPGDELYNHLLNHGRMEPAKVQKIFTQLVGAVSYVHGKSCVHRDLKLENILLDKHENVKLVDFGFTREYQGSTSYLQTWCGTVCYSAPEMLRGEKYAGEKVDVWSLGIILYALLCGELPWDEDDETATKVKILKEEPNYPAYLPDPAVTLLKKLLSKRPILRPTLGDLLKEPWLSEHAPQQQEILKIQQPAPFTTQLEKDVLQRMRSAGVDIDLVIANVLSQRCDALAGWWALLLEKEQRKERRKERKRKDREADAKALRRLSAASGRLLANLGEIHEGEEHAISDSPRKRGRPLSRANGNGSVPPDLPRVAETKPLPPDIENVPTLKETGERIDSSRSRSRPPPPPKDTLHPTVTRRTRAASRSSQSMLRNVTLNPDLLSPSYVPAPQRRRRTFYAPPLKEQLAWVKHFFRDGALKRGKSPTTELENGKNTTSPKRAPPGDAPERGTLLRISTGPLPRTHSDSIGGGDRPELVSRNTMPARPRINTASSAGSVGSGRAKRTSLSPHALTPHSSYRRSTAGLRGRKSTSSSVSSIRSTYQGHQHTHSKASSTSSASLASPSGLSSASGSRLARSPHSSVKVLPQTPTNSGLPSGIRISRRPLPGSLGVLPTFGEAHSAFAVVGAAPVSPGLPVFARRKRSVFKGPMSGSPSGAGRNSSHGNARSTSVQGRPSTEMMPGVAEEEEDEEAEELEDEDEVYEEVDQFGGELGTAVLEPTDGGEPVTPLSAPGDPETPAASPDKGKVPLTAEALAMMEEEEEKKELEADKELAAVHDSGP